MNKKLVAIMFFIFIYGIFIKNINLEAEEYVNELDISSSFLAGDINKHPDWYDIGTSLKCDVDYSNSDLLKYVKKGDIIYEEMNEIDNDDNNLYKSLTGHIAIVEGIFYDETYGKYYIRIIESMPTIGVTRGLLCEERFNYKKTEIYRLIDNDSDIIDAAVDFVISQLGCDYDWNAYSDAFEKSEVKWYCSELVGQAYYNQGIDLSTGNKFLLAKIIYPKEISESSLLSLIMHYKYTTTCVSNDEDTHKYTCNERTSDYAHTYVTMATDVDTKVCSECGQSKHTHNYTYSYTWKNKTQHTAKCSCGSVQLQGHAVLASNTSKCVLCNGTVSVGFVGIESIDGKYVTDNGSYIASNGVIVLVDKDLEAYLNGTLEFYLKGEDIM